jgi:hypothetical protein
MNEQILLPRVEENRVRKASKKRNHFIVTEYKRVYFVAFPSGRIVKVDIGNPTVSRNILALEGFDINL